MNKANDQLHNTSLPSEESNDFEIVEHPNKTAWLFRLKPEKHEFNELMDRLIPKVQSDKAETLTRLYQSANGVFAAEGILKILKQVQEVCAYHRHPLASGIYKTKSERIFNQELAASQVLVKLMAEGSPSHTL